MFKMNNSDVEAQQRFESERDKVLDFLTKAIYAIVNDSKDFYFFRES